MMRDGDSGGKRKRGREAREKNNARRKGTHCTRKWLKRGWISLWSHAKWSTRMDDFNTIFADSIELFFYCLFSKEQRWRTGKQTVWWMKSLGPFVLDCDKRWKYEDTLVSFSCEGLDFPWSALNMHTQTELCDNHINLHWSCHWAFMKSSMLFFHTAYCTAA